MRVSIAKARQVLGYEPKTPLREGIRLTAEWLQSHHAGAATPVSGAGT
jgi:nucleoside-diphosphate-sugar epimerase